MRRYFVATIAILSFVAACYAQDAAKTSNAPDPTTTVVIARTGMTVETPNVATYHYLEILQVRHGWIVPDVGYIDFGGNHYHEFFVGGGRTLYDGKHGSLIEELYFDQAFGPAAKSARYLQVFTAASLKLTAKWTVSGVYFPYLPINRTARIQHVLENVKIERSVKAWKVGLGYGGYKYGNDKWQSKPFVTVTRGPVEIWPFQKMPGGGQVQLRLTFAHTARTGFAQQD